jgi:GTPase-associated protein 1, N-terminal domain type 2/GTPase-associated protein 1, C-terminal domain/GTPase-associated protein 1, middle domain
MPFQQLHYTSCERGLAGHSGFQFCAISDGVSRETMREVERLTVYEPARGAAGLPAVADDEQPTNLLYTISETSGLPIIARVTFVGLDFSNRSGNYFAHTLVATEADADFGATLPAELWDSPFWQESQGEATSLPALPALPEKGPVSRDLADAFLAAGGRRPDLVALLLTAVGEAVCGGRRVLLVERDAPALAGWIAALSYLLGTTLARDLTFSTYAHDPERSRVRLAGIVSAAGPLGANVRNTFAVFDMPGGAFPEMPTAPAATLLARVGAAGAVPLWELAASVHGPPDGSLAGWFPPLASAALMLGHPLTASELRAAVDYLAASGEFSSGQVAVAIRQALGQPLGNLTPSQQEQLAGLAFRADGAGSDAHGSLAAQVETRIVEDAMARVDSGGLPGEGFPLRTEQAMALAAEGCSQRVCEIGAARAVGLLAWAYAVHARPDPGAVRRAGQGVIIAELLGTPQIPGLDRAASEWPALREGMVAGLASLPKELRHRIFAGPATRVFRSSDFTKHPDLCEEWVIRSVASQQIAPVEALRQVISLRRSRGEPEPVSEDLLSQLWASRDWTPAEAAEIVKKLPHDELAGEVLRGRLAGLLAEIPARPDYAAWAPFTGLLAGLPAGVLSNEQVELARALAVTMPLVEAAATPDKDAGEEIDKLIGLYDASKGALRDFLNRHLPGVLLLHVIPGQGLARCSWTLMFEFCAQARAWLADERVNTVVAARVYVATLALRNLGYEQRSLYLEDQLLLPLVEVWSRGKFAAVGAEAGKIYKNGHQRMSLWYKQNKPRRFQFRVPGFGPGRRED